MIKANPYIELVLNQLEWKKKLKGTDKILDHLKDDFIGAFYDNYYDDNNEYKPSKKLMMLVQKISNANVVDKELFMNEVYDDFAEILKEYKLK